MQGAVQRKKSVALPLEAASFLTDQLEAPWIQAAQHSCWQFCHDHMEFDFDSDQ